MTPTVLVASADAVRESYAALPERTRRKLGQIHNRRAPVAGRLEQLAWLWAVGSDAARFPVASVLAKDVVDDHDEDQVWVYAQYARYQAGAQSVMLSQFSSWDADDAFVQEWEAICQELGIDCHWREDQTGALLRFPADWHVPDTHSPEAALGQSPEHLWEEDVRWGKLFNDVQMLFQSTAAQAPANGLHFWGAGALTTHRWEPKAVWGGSPLVRQVIAAMGGYPQDSETPNTYTQILMPDEDAYAQMWEWLLKQPYWQMWCADGSGVYRDRGWRWWQSDKDQTAEKLWR